MPTIHPKARTTPAVRAEIARSTEPTGILAQRHGVSTEEGFTVVALAPFDRRWRA